MKGEKTALDMQLLELERRQAELELQVGTAEGGDWKYELEDKIICKTLIVYWTFIFFQK